MRLLIGGSSSKIFHLEEFAKLLEKFGVTTKVVYDAEYTDGYPSRKISTWIQSDSKFKKLINEFRPDAILIDRQRHFGIAAIKHKIPLLVHLRGDFWKEIKMAEKTLYKSFPKKMALKKWEEMADKCFKNAIVILPICNHLAERTLEEYPEKNVKVLYQGINPENWFQSDGMNLKHPCVGLVQSANILEKTKEMLTLNKILEEFPDVTFYWAGDGPYRDEVLNSLNQYDNFEWLGSLDYPDKVREFLSEIDIYALISGIDMAPLTLLEAQLMEKPVIATRVGGIPELMSDEETGFLVEKGNSEQISDKIKILMSDKAKAQLIGKNGRRFVIDNFEWNIIAKKFVDILKEIIRDV